MTDTLDERERLRRENREQMNRAFAHDTRSRIESFVLGCWVLADEGHSDSLLGQVSVRGEAPDRFLTQRLGLGLDEVAAENLIEFDSRLRNHTSAEMVHPGLSFHVWLYRHRPDVNAIVHTHPPYSVALAMTNQPLRPMSMNAAMLFDEVAYLKHWPGTPEGDEEGELICEALGSRSAILLANHGLLTVGDSFDIALYRAVFFERAAKAQLLASAHGELKAVTQPAAQSAKEAMTRPGYVRATVDYWYRQAARRRGISGSAAAATVPTASGTPPRARSR
ncbi:MAG TPA: class II aldolase/adducin family protein [Burkholderiaceae bacterium]|jgi:L-fuculose-phosphate aldolase|nr:class II aldolase/adducin family protein [Burkholderiaceae bacterium]